MVANTIYLLYSDCMMKLLITDSWPLKYTFTGQIIIINFKILIIINIFGNHMTKIMAFGLVT